MARYENIGKHDVFGHAPGEIFEADLDPITEARLIGGGHLARVSISSSAAGGFSSSSSTSIVGGTPMNVLPGQKVAGETKNDDADTHDADDDVAA